MHLTQSTKKKYINQKTLFYFHTWTLQNYRVVIRVAWSYSHKTIACVASYACIRSNMCSLWSCSVVLVVLSLLLSFFLACLFLFLFLTLFLVDIFLVLCYFYLSVADVSFHVYINLFFFLSFLLNCNMAVLLVQFNTNGHGHNIFFWTIFCDFKDIPFHWAWFNMCLILTSV